MRKPRQVKVLSTEHFDILFSKESTFSAKIIAENAENIFNKVIFYFIFLLEIFKQKISFSFVLKIKWVV